VPLYEYKCLACGDQFETLVRGASPPECPACRSTDLERLLSAFGVSSKAIRQNNLSKARKAGEKQRRDKQHAEAEAAAAHAHDHDDH
jgi:putative FmdB family regulatory protein